MTVLKAFEPRSHRLHAAMVRRGAGARVAAAAGMPGAVSLLTRRTVAPLSSRDVNNRITRPARRRLSVPR